MEKQELEMKVLNTFQGEGCREIDKVSKDREDNLSPSMHTHVHTFFFSYKVPISFRKWIVIEH